MLKVRYSIVVKEIEDFIIAQNILHMALDVVISSSCASCYPLAPLAPVLFDPRTNLDAVWHLRLVACPVRGGRIRAVQIPVR
jgi:hypothetical protein